MKVDLYYVAIYLGSTNVTQATIPFGNNSWTINGLENNKAYTFNISVRNSNKNITSMACLKTLTTGDPCKHKLNSLTLKYQYPNSTKNTKVRSMTITMKSINLLLHIQITYNWWYRIKYSLRRAILKSSLFLSALQVHVVNYYPYKYKLNRIVVIDYLIIKENETQADCYISTYIDVEDFYNGTNDPYIAVLPPVANCYNNKCSLKFVLDQNY